MKSNRIKVLLIVSAISLPLMSCTAKLDKVISGNQKSKPIEISQSSLSKEENKSQENHSIEVVLQSISQVEYDNWVLKSYDGWSRPNGEPLTLPSIADFDYPSVEGIENRELKNKINETIKNAIFTDDFFSKPMSGVKVATTPYSEFEFPGSIIHKDIVSIPITLYWNVEKSHYKAMSVTIDMKTGERLFLEDIINLNEEFAYKLIYEKGFFIDIDLVGIGMKEYLHGYFKAGEDSPSKASKWLLETLRKYKPEVEKPEVELFYLTEDGIVLTHFANDGVPQEINIPLKNLQNYLKIDSWK